MRRYKFLGALLCVPFFAVLLALPGCGGGEPDIVKKKKARPDDSAKNGKPVGDPALVAIEPKEYGTLSGTITLDGEVKVEAQDFSGPDAAQCQMGSEFEKVKQTWLFNNSNKGLANVVVFLKAPDGKFFKLKEEDKKQTKDVELRQPHCAFLPHVVALFPEYYDAESKSMKPTGQKLKVTNDAKFNHNTGIIPNDESINSKAGFTLGSGESKSIELKPDPSGPVGFKCDIHGWMNAKGWVFDHPYFAVTDKDGKFEIKNVPVGVPVNVVGWHEGAGYFHGGPNGTVSTLQPKGVMDLKVKAK